MLKQMIRHWALVAVIGCTFWQGSIAAPSEYDELVVLFEDFRTFQDASLADGAPDYSAAAIAKQWEGLESYRDRLRSIDTAEWPVWQQVDYHLVRAEMNAVEFQIKVQRPWARDPGFYSMMAGDAGATINAPTFFEPLFKLLGFSEDGPPPSEEQLLPGLQLSPEEQSRLENTLNAIPAMYAQAKRNLTEPAADLAEFAIRNFEEERSVYEEIENQLASDYPDLASAAGAAALAVEKYRTWMKETQSSMAPYAGLGKRNYDWWLRNVQLSPWG